MSTFILQNTSTHEIRTIRHAAMLLDNVNTLNCSIDNLHQYLDELKNQAVPVGSVEFVRKAMEIAGLQEPANISYPIGCEQFLRRKIQCVQLGEVHDKCFIKPCETKLFTGFVYNLSNLENLNDHDLEQYQVLKTLPSTTPVWVSDVVNWQAECRYYVAFGEIVGVGRYDDGDSNETPNDHVVQLIIQSINLQHPYALDVGVLDTGQTALVEVNDAWAIGLYGNTLAPRDYLYFLRNRWRSLFKKD